MSRAVIGEDASRGCAKAGAPRVAPQVLTKIQHIQPIKGVWRVVHKRQDKQYSRLWFTVNTGKFSFAYTSFKGSKDWQTVRKLLVGDYVRLQGQLAEKAELDLISRCTKRAITFVA